MSRGVIGAVLATIIAVLTFSAYTLTTSRLENGIQKDVEQRVGKLQELLIQNTTLEMLTLKKLAEALALDPKLARATGGGTDADGETIGADPVLAEQVFKKFRADLSAQEAQPDIMAMTDKTGQLISLMLGGKEVRIPVPDTYLQSGKIAYWPVEAAIEDNIVTSQIWEYPGSGVMKITAAPILDLDGSTRGAVLVGYAITSPDAMKQKALLGAEVIHFYGDEIHSTSLGKGDEQKDALRKVLFADGMAKQAFSSSDHMGDYRHFEFGGETYVGITGEFSRFASKALGDKYPKPRAGAMVMISLTSANSSVGSAGIAILAVGFFSIILMLVGISLTSKRILGPLEQIEVGVNDIINGNLNRTFEPVGTDLDGLANALNVMLARLLGRPEPGEEEFDEDGNIIQPEIVLPSSSGAIPVSAPIDPKQAEADALAAEPIETYLRRLHGEFVAARNSAGDSSEVVYDDFVAKLNSNEASLKQKYGAREVRFKVVSDSGKVTLKPVPIV
ncbi:MAG: hypothetical protein JKY56_13960 [Kofleriaceae bacterium]|nr:hypothetical protein [Kofleriaceae bacterium]